MNKYLLKIKLLSDMCVSDGGVYNSSVDIDICYDSYGFPYIPAKRIRGCLRECAIELQDWGVNIPWQTMFGFGKKGSSTNRAEIRIGNACLDGMEEMKKLARKNCGKTVFHPQNILNHFTYIRTQTAIDYETGVADATSLRSMRVADKGLTFIAEVEMNPKYEENLKACCAVFHNIGVSRTRGLGEISVSLEEGSIKMSELSDDTQAHIPYEKGSEILWYQLQLEEPVICKSVNGGEARTLDYIEGSKMLGLLIENADSEDKEAIICTDDGDELFCSNAYISVNDIRCTEVPAYIYSVKNDEKHYVNKLYPDPVCIKENNLQLNMMKHCYIYIDENQKLHKESVRIEERYHHRRPEDKGIGRAAEEKDGDSRFYQMSSIEAGQTFRGYFAGSEEQIKKVYEILSKQEVYYIGYSRTSEYGKVRLRITDLEKKPQATKKKAKTFCVKLEAPAVVYNENAFYSTNVQDLIDEVNTALGITMSDGQTDIRRYVRYTTLGGFNTTWGRPKPDIMAFDKGTVLFYSLAEESELTIPSTFVIGERVKEGYGEASLCIVDGMEDIEKLLEIESGQSIQSEDRVDAKESSFTSDLCKDLYEDYLHLEAAQDAKASGFGPDTRATVSNMLLMYQENERFDGVKNACSKRYGRNTDDKKKKLGYAEKILEIVEKNTMKIRDDFCQKYQIQNFEFDDNTEKMRYLYSFLQQLKYDFRQAERRKRGGKNE